jgi:hypothetical protein
LVTNIQPNYLLLGCNFFKCSEYVYNCDRHLAVIVHSAPELLQAVSQILKAGRHKEEGLIYVYYDRLRHDDIRTEAIDEHCIVFDHYLKLHVNCLLKRPLNDSEAQIMSTFMQSEGYARCCPWMEGTDKLLPTNSLRHSFEPKER